MSWWASFSAPFRQLKRRFWVTFLCAWAAAQAIEWSVGRAMHEHCADEVSSSLVVATGFYQKLATRKREPVVRYTSLVVIDPERDIGSISRSNICAERDFLARMLERLADAGVKTVVIDKFFGAGTCPNGEPGTLKLVSMIDHLRKGEPTAPGKPAREAMAIVVGLRAVEVDEAQRKLPEVTSYVAPSLRLETDATRGQQGLVNADFDTRRAALQWAVYPDLRSAEDGRVVVVDTLPFAAAKLQNPRLLVENQPLAALVESGRQPFIAFIKPEQFEPHRHFASEIVCGKPLASQEDWPGCFGQAAVPSGMAGRIVIIAEEDQGDQHNTIIGRIAGYYLVANYIEALLDDRFLMPAWPGVNTLFSFTILLTMELLLFVFHSAPVRAVASMVGLVLVVAFILFEVVVNLGVYIDPTLVTGAYVVFRLSHIAYAHVKHPKHDEPPARNPPDDEPPEETQPSRLEGA